MAALGNDTALLWVPTESREVTENMILYRLGHFLLPVDMPYCISRAAGCWSFRLLLILPRHRHPSSPPGRVLALLAQAPSSSLKLCPLATYNLADYHLLLEAPSLAARPSLQGPIFPQAPLLEPVQGT